IPLSADHNVFDCEHLLVLTAQKPPLAKQISTMDDPVGTLRMLIDWSEHDNVYRRGLAYFGWSLPSRPDSIASADIHGIDRWESLWKLSPTRSVDGEIRFQLRTDTNPGPLALDTVDSLSGPFPNAVGTHPDRVGPGTAYAAWRRSPQYT